MKRLSSVFALALLASLVAAPAALAQPKTAPTTPVPTAQPDKTPAPKIEKPKTDAPKADKPTPPKGDAPKAPSADDKMKAYEESSKPGPSHKMLEQFKGEWAAEVKDLTPGEETSDKGTMSCDMVFGGRFITMAFDGRSHGKFFKGGGMMGYNNAEKRFETTWADSMSTGILFLTGSSSNDGKTFTLTGDATNPMTGKKAMWKEVIAFTSKDAWHDDFFMVDGVKEMKVMEIAYTRAAKADKKDDSMKKDEPKKDEPKTAEPKSTDKPKK